jgi:hypothetical protein
MARTQTGSGYQSTYDTSLSTTIAVPSTGNIASIAAGSLVVATFRYESGSGGTISSVSDSAGGTYTVHEYSTQPRSAIAYCYNHPGGSSVVVTATLTAVMAYREGYVGVFSGTVGESDPVDGSPVTSDGTNPSISITVSASGMMVMAAGCFSAGTPYVATSPAQLMATQRSYSAALWRTYTGSGSFTIAATGGAGTSHNIALAFKDPAAAGSNIIRGIKGMTGGMQNLSGGIA